MTVVSMSGHDWDTYAHLEEQGMMKEIVSAPWEQNACEPEASHCLHV